LEYAYDDYALATVAGKLGKTADYHTLIQRSLNYRNVFDPAVGMVRGRYSSKTWYKPFRPSSKEPYITEGTPQQYTFYVPQDVTGLARLMGGKASLEKSLDQLFDHHEYWHGNEPGHQIPFMYNYTGSPWKTQQHVKQILTDEYSDGPGGLSGNDDAGQMSAWFVFASIGFYPLDPVSNNYILTAPLFDRVTIRLPNAKTFHIVTHKQAAQASYISSVKWNGKPYTKNYLTYQTIINGGQLDIFMTSKPNKTWAVLSAAQPSGLKK
jgi:predicted alpha-1,2-mannosidase